MTATEYSEQEMEQINQFTKRALKPNEVYTFEVVLCDNEVDRDGECFSGESLDQLAELYLGKTGIFDHNPSGKNQTARIYRCWTEELPERETKLGFPYKRLKAKAYLVKTKKNEDLILEIEGGIKKEVSVGCRMGEKVCSVCGTDWYHGSCAHQKGVYYEGTLCCGILQAPADAYEWSFVAVPAQPAAGIVKAYRQEGTLGDRQSKGGVVLSADYNIVKEKLSYGQTQKSEQIVLTKSEGKILLERLSQLEQQAEYGTKFLENKRNNIKRLILLSEEQLPVEAVDSVVGKMNLKELEQYETYYRKKNGLQGLMRGTLPQEQQKKDGWEAQKTGQQSKHNRNEGFKI